MVKTTYQLVQDFFHQQCDASEVVVARCLNHQQYGSHVTMSFKTNQPFSIPASWYRGHVSVYSQNPTKIFERTEFFPKKNLPWPHPTPKRMAIWKSYIYIYCIYIYIFLQKHPTCLVRYPSWMGPWAWHKMLRPTSHLEDGLPGLVAVVNNHG